MPDARIAHADDGTSPTVAASPDVRAAFRWVFAALALVSAAAAAIARSIPDVDLATTSPADARPAPAVKA